MAKSYDPDTNYDEYETYQIAGKALNQIGDLIRELRRDIAHLERKLDSKKVEEMEEELKILRLRDRYPSLKAVYDEYQTVLALVSEKEEKRS